MSNARSRPITANSFAIAGRRFQAVRDLESGLSVAVVDELAGALDLPASDVRKLAKISASTFGRRQKAGLLSPEESDRIYRLQTVVTKAIAFYEGNKVAARKWLNAPAPALGGNRPIALLVNAAGVGEVESLLGRLEYGVFT